MTAAIIFQVFAIAFAFALLVVVKIRARKESDGAKLDATPVTTEQIEQTIREEIAPQNRPYGDTGLARDNAGKTYVVAKNGSLRRFGFAEKHDGSMEVVLVKKPGKALRKAAKRAKRADRGIIVTPIPGT